jgi:hypothetical protein
MKLQDRLPEGVEVDGKFYKLDFDFRNVFRMIDILDEENLMPEAREYNALKCLTKHPRNVHKVLSEVKKLLFKSPRKASGQKVTDFIQDAGLIRSAFRQVYGIDLYRDRLHWIEFTELLNAIPEGNRYSEVVGIRARPIPAPTKWNQNERNWLIRAKSDVALEMSEKERAERYDKDVQNIASFLMGWAKGSEKKDV